jgi:hypothetical protein
MVRRICHSLMGKATMTATATAWLSEFDDTGNAWCYKRYGGAPSPRLVDRRNY